MEYYNKSLHICSRNWKKIWLIYSHRCENVETWTDQDFKISVNFFFHIRRNYKEFCTVSKDFSLWAAFHLSFYICALSPYNVISTVLGTRESKVTEADKGLH